MIVSASRRTDIPALYGEWLLGRLHEGFAEVRNPFNPNLVRRVPLAAGVTDLLVFWTKDPGPMLPLLGAIDGFGLPYYFLFTVTPYGTDLEQNLPPKEKLLETFLELAGRLGPERVIWRYDPILFTGEYTPAFHREAFRRMARRLQGATKRCVISFLQLYAKCRRNLQPVRLMEQEPEEKVRLVRDLLSVAGEYGMGLQACADDAAGPVPGLEPTGCIDAGLASRLLGRPVPVDRDTHQRPQCRCACSVDIGAYDTCLHHCLYCYAGRSHETSCRNHGLHAPASPRLLG